MKRVILFLLIFTAFMVLIAGSGRVSVEMNSVLASVNGQAVTLVDVLPLTRARELQAHSVYSGERLQRVIADYRKEVVNELIDNILIQNEFTRQKFALAEQDVEREIDRFAIRIGCRSREQLVKKLRKDGSSIEEVRLGIRKNMMVQLMLFRQIRIADPVTPKELYDFFKLHESDYAVPEKVGLAMLKLDSNRNDLAEITEKISVEIKKDPARFSEIADMFNGKSGNSDLGEIDSKLLRPEFAAAFKEFKPGTVAGPLKVYDGVVWLKVTSWKPAQKPVFSEVESRIKNDLEREKREKIIASYISRLRANAVIEYF